MEIVTKLTPWPSSLHRVSINSFGYGGANAHAILESVDSFLPEYREAQKGRIMSNPTKQYLLPFSASTTESLNARVADIVERFDEGESYSFSDICYTLACRRTTLDKKGFLIASEAVGRTNLAVDRLITRNDLIPVLDFGFVFTGQGAQWPQMGRELLEKHPEFVATIESLDAVLAALPEAPSWTIKNALLEPAPSSKIGEAALSQPLCTAVQVGIVNLLHKWRITPRAVVGHSSGEIAAAYTAGLLTEAQAIIIAYYRGYVVSKITSDGCMMAVGMDAEGASQLLKDLCLQDKVCVACVNSPESITISGVSQGINELLRYLEPKGIFTRKLPTGGRAYHSFLMREIGEEYENLVNKALSTNAMPFDASDRRSQTENDTRVTFFSSVGEGSQALEVFTKKTHSFLRPSYWRKNLENPVQFNTALKNLVAAGSYHLIEIGPHSAMQGPIKQIRKFMGVSDSALPYSPTLLRSKDADLCMKELAGDLYLIGHTVNFLAINDIVPSRDSQVRAHLVTDLPPYHWTYGTDLLWKEPRASVDLRKREYVRHELLGNETTASNGIERSWRNILKPAEVPWLDDHRVSQQCLLFLLFLQVCCY